jgi:DNA-binding transcriptional ArsR family regulator
MSTKSAAALPAALRGATGERFVIEAARRVHRALGDTNRLDLVRRLAQSPATVTELIESTDLSQPLVSWHLRRLRSAGLVTSERAGRESSPHSASPTQPPGLHLKRRYRMYNHSLTPFARKRSSNGKSRN